MLKEIELGIIAGVRASALGDKLTQVAALPEITGEELVKNFASDAPGVYVVTGDFNVVDDQFQLSLEVAAVIRNASSQIAPRHGDGLALGLFEMVEILVPVLNGIQLNDAVLYVSRVQWMKSDLLYKNGLELAVINLTATVQIPAALDADALNDFLTLGGQYDIEPHASKAEHGKWVENPPDYSTSKPDLTDTTILPT